MANVLANLPHGTFSPGVLTRLVLTLSQNTVLGRGRARRIMAHALRALNKGPLDVTLFGLRARLYLRNNNSEIKALLRPDRYARREIEFAAKLLPPKGGVVIDIGANAGLFALRIASIMRGGVLIAAEPQPRLFERLVTNLEKLNLNRPNGPVCKFWNCAIGAENASSDLYVPKQLGQASLEHKVDGAAMISVPLRTLRSVVEDAGIDTVDLLKIDIEGYEDRVLAAFFEEAPLSLFPRGIVLEHCHSDRWKRDCDGILIAKGYHCVGRDRSNTLYSLREPT
ncbi:MAG: FkbM family methyltransferase [Pseudomonadota bacterium]